MHSGCMALGRRRLRGQQSRPGLLNQRLNNNKGNNMTTQPKTVSTSSLIQEGRTFPPSQEVIQRAHINAALYEKMYERSIKDPDGFWLEQAATLDWFKKPT